MSAHNPLHNREAEAAPGEFGAEEGVEDPGLTLFRDATARIGNF